MTKKKDWRKIKEECCRFTKPSHPLTTKTMHRLIAAYNRSIKDNPGSMQAEAREF